MVSPPFKRAFSEDLRESYSINPILSWTRLKLDFNMVQVWVLLCKEGCVLSVFLSFSPEKGSSLWLIGLVFKKNVNIYTFLEASGPP